ncbi:MAG TPA: hypothetical protein VFT12_09090 [Thermoanaerobaculia bacterium]|nr:hypothetical protein [Thermoanaerobaculia bacterium]
MPMTLAGDGPLRYVVSVPAAAAARPPLLVFLHGYDEGLPTEIRAGLTRHGPLRPGSSARAAGDFVIVAPQLPVCGDHWLRYEDSVRRIVSSVAATHGCDPNRFYLTGFSFGGNGVFDLAIVQPDLWAALWPVDPTRVPRVDPARPVWLSAGEIARHRKAPFISSLALQKLSVPAGDRVWCDEGEDHVGSATRAYRDDRIYDWLLARQR